MLTQLTQWTLAWSLHPLASWALFILAFTESTFFPIPPDVVLIPMALAKPKAAFFYGGLCTLGSVLGALAGFLMGAKGGRPFLNKFFKPALLAKAEKLFQNYGGWAVGLAALTPIPFKVFTLSAGAFRADLKVFTMASVLGRGLRFFAISFLIFYWGEAAKIWIQENFTLVSIALGLLLIVGLLAFKAFQRFKKQA